MMQAAIATVVTAGAANERYPGMTLRPTTGPVMDELVTGM